MVSMTSDLIVSRGEAVEAYTKLAEAVSKGSSISARQRAVQNLKNVGYILPDKAIGATIVDLRDTFKQPHVVLIGSVAFEVYCGMKGLLNLPRELVSTFDVDIAFAGTPSAGTVPPRTCANDYIRESAHGVKLDFVIPETLTQEFRGSSPHWTYVAPMESYAHVIPGDRRLLLHKPIRAVIAHGDGVPVKVPHPLNFAMHKLIVSTVRDNTAKADKDRRQASILLNQFANAADKTTQIASLYFSYRDGSLNSALEDALSTVMPNLALQATEWLQRGLALAKLAA